MMTRRLLACGFFCRTVAAFAQDNCITIPQGEYRLVRSPFTVNNPPLLTPSFSVLTWAGSYFNEDYYAAGGWDSPPMWAYGQGVVVHPIGGSLTICFPEPAQSPRLPLPLGCGLNLVCAQSNIVAGFEEIVGRAPWEGVQVHQFNAGPGRLPAHFGPPDYTIYTFSGGSWSPSVPVAQIGQAVFVHQPSPQLWNVRLVDGHFGFEVTAPPASTVVVEYSEGDPSGWTELTTFTGSGTFQPLSDGTAIGGKLQRFYRLRVSLAR